MNDLSKRREARPFIELRETCNPLVREALAESLDTPVAGADGASATRLDNLGESDPRYERVHDVQAVAPVLRALPDRERQILSLRFGEDLPQSEIARRLGISQMHVSRLLRRTLDEVAEGVQVA